MTKSTLGGEGMDTAVESLAEEALAVLDEAKNGHGMPALDTELHRHASSPAEAPQEEAATPQDDAPELKAILEALLFVSPEPLTVERCMSALGDVTKAQVREALALMQHEYDQRSSGLQLVQIAGGYRLVTRPQYASWIRRLEKTKAHAKLSRSAVEALAIIAYRQPVVRGELEKIRGVETSGVIRTLLERKLVRIVGRKDEPGRPIMYGTTKQFLEHFGLRDLSELPPLREFKELGEGDQSSLLEEVPLGGEELESESQAEHESGAAVAQAPHELIANETAPPVAEDIVDEVVEEAEAMIFPIAENG